GAALGILFAWLAVQGLAAVAPVTLPRLEHIAIDARVLAFTVVIALVTGILFGLVPAWRGASAGMPTTLALDSRGSVGADPRARARCWSSPTSCSRSSCWPAQG